MKTARRREKERNYFGEYGDYTEVFVKRPGAIMSVYE